MTWDVTISDQMEQRRKNEDYFDPRLSYELTGYIPIDETHSLDFDPKPFTEAGQIKLKRGKYCEYQFGTKAHKDFWTEQKRRCEEGYQVGKYRITGDHYFFLNFHPLLNVTTVTRAGEGRDNSFGSFWVEHYKYTHYLEMCERLGRDVVLLKSRGVGLSELGAATAARLYTTTKNSKCLFTAFAEDFLLGDGILPKIWTTLDYLNEETEYGFKHLRQKTNSVTHKRASLSKKDGTEYGHMAEIIGLVIDNPRKLRGGRYERIYFEEAGSFKNLKKVYTQAEALIDILGKRIGTRIVWGTGRWYCIHLYI